MIDVTYRAVCAPKCGVPGALSLPAPSVLDLRSIILFIGGGTPGMPGLLAPLAAPLAAGETTVDIGAGADRIMSSFDTAIARTSGSTGMRVSFAAALRSETAVPGVRGLRAGDRAAELLFEDLVEDVGAN